MTKKDYVLISATIKTFNPRTTPVELDKESIRAELACHFAAALVPTNKLFDKARFIRACTT